MPTGLSLKTSATELVKIEAPFKALSNKDQRILREGLREGGDKTRTKIRRALKQQMGLKTYGTIVAHTWGGLEAGSSPGYVIRGDGKGLPIAQFQGLRVKKLPPQPRDTLGRFTARPYGTGAISARPWGVLHAFKRSFLNHKGVPIARRPTGERHALYGPSPAKEIVKGQALGIFRESVAMDVRAAIEKRLLRAYRA